MLCLLSLDIVMGFRRTLADRRCRASLEGREPGFTSPGGCPRQPETGAAGGKGRKKKLRVSRSTAGKKSKTGIRSPTGKAKGRMRGKGNKTQGH